MNWNYKLEIKRKDILDGKGRGDGRNNDRDDIGGVVSKGDSKRILV